MKRIISAVLVCVLLVGCMFALASCGKTLSGKYSADAFGVAGTSYEFSGKKVDIKFTVLGFEKTVSGEYEIAENDDGELEITFTFASDEEDADDFKGTHSFSEGEEDGVKYIKIGGIKYKKAK